MVLEFVLEFATEDELFLATHTKKDGGWVDGRAREIYEKYHERLRAMQAVASEGSSSDL
ncbi:putative transposase [Vigna unguiculata]|uniref:Putative transposase n=1 Tax=Vigna unguiculata TaxID=3917 RepID=A0A4D6MZ88_VIGUN|nr:putative transposase [Vigna unguiculata]